MYVIGSLPRLVACGRSALRLAVGTAVLVGCGGPPGLPTRRSPAPSAALPALAAGSPAAPAPESELRVTAPRAGWALGSVSWAAADSNGLIYLLQRGDSADPIVVVDREGGVVRSWGGGMFTVAHSIRVDPAGNVWTTDAHTSVVRKFSRHGTPLLRIDAGPTPAECTARRWRTCGTTDVAFAPNGHVLVTDGYWNARVLEFTADGRKVREWGTKGSGPGEFNLPHSIVIDSAGVVYVADRGNGRVQRFDLQGRFLGAWSTDGDPYSLQLAAGAMWMGVLRQPGSAEREPTIVRADPGSGAATARLRSAGGHGLGALPDGEQLLVPAGSRVFLLPTRTSPRR